MTFDPIRLAAVGLGRGFALTARALADHPEITLVAAATRSAETRRHFEASFGGRSFETLDAMLADDAIEMVYVATPHQLHREHVCACLNAGKHVVVEKPMAIDLGDADAMIDLAQQTGLQLLVGPSHSYDAPVELAASLIASGKMGRPRLLQGLMSTDFLYRPRRPEELRTQDGGGVVFSQAVHHIDVAMRLIGEAPETVYARTGGWDDARGSEGAYAALLSFPHGATASLTYSGYGYFDSDVWMENVSELGLAKAGDRSGVAQRALATVKNEAEHKKSRAFSGLSDLPDPDAHEHFGPLVLFCERGDLRLTPHGVVLHGPDGTEEIKAPFQGARFSFAQALVGALRGGGAPVQTGIWGSDALRTCHAILKSAQTGLPVTISDVTNA